MTLEQERAKDAWEVCGKYDKDAVNVAKALPALIMNSGLMQVMAFCHEKEKHQKHQKHHEQVAGDLRKWLFHRFGKSRISSSDFEPFMQSLYEASPECYQAITAEAFAWLKWLKHMAGARSASGGK